jgi:L-lactate utilization protein LutC
MQSIPEDATLQKTAQALKEHNIDVIIVNNRDEAREKALSLLPKGAEVMNMSSVTLEETGINKALEESTEYDLVKHKLMKMNRETQGREMQQLGAAPEYAIGSVHAVTEDGYVIIASNTGSQLPAYSYGSSHVIWVVGAQKIVKDEKAGMERIYNYVLPKESERVQKAYGMKESFVSKLLVVKREMMPGRTTMILVREVLGY